MYLFDQYRKKVDRKTAHPFLFKIISRVYIMYIQTATNHTYIFISTGRDPGLLLLRLRHHPPARWHAGRALRWQVLAGPGHPVDRAVHPADAAGCQVGRRQCPHRSPHPHGPGRRHDVPGAKRHAGTVDAAGGEVKDRLARVCRCTVG